MIEYTLPQHAIDFIEWLNSKKLCDAPCKMGYLANMAGVKTGDGTGWACYEIDRAQMVITGDFSTAIVQCSESGTEQEIDCDEEDQRFSLYTTISHEYMHHIQKSAGRELSEDEAETFANDIVLQYLNETKYNGSDEWTWEKLAQPHHVPVSV